MVFSPGLAFALPHSHFQRVFQVVSNFWIGIFFIGISLILITHLIKFITTKTGTISRAKWQRRKYIAISGTIVFLLTVSVSTYGLITCKTITDTQYVVNVDKSVNGLSNIKVVLIADLHMGYNMGVHSVETMVNKINQMEPDLICIAGDIFNNTYDALEDEKAMLASLSNLKSTYGTYACYGNHDVKEPILAGFTFSDKKNKDKRPVSDPRMDKFLKDANIKLLQDEVVLVDDKFYVGGRLDDQKPGRTAAIRMTEEEITRNLDKSKPIIIIDHSPTSNALEGLAANGVDVDLSGHTHNGQFFPLNLSAKFMWDNPTGILQVRNMTSIVTSGVGVFGPDIRLGTKSEIVEIKMNFK
ncbi:MAG: metallophosphoesterase [Anaerovoracaceae bacterium]